MDISSTKDDALQNAILATELYMKAAKLASSDQERTRLRAKCKALLSKAEQIKRSESWTPIIKTAIPALLKAPSSERKITRHEEIILLEGSKLHGFIFPPWKSDPEDAVFDDDLPYT